MAESKLQDEPARISRVATMLRAQGLALAFEADDASGWAASIIQATAQASAVDMRGHGVSRAAAAENVWKRHIAPSPDSEMDVRASATLGTRPALKREEER